MQEKLPGIENTLPVTERRACPRFRVTSLMYVDIGNISGGIVTSLSEKGLALTAADNLENAEFGDRPLRMHIQFPGTPEAIEASGEIIWTSPSGKEARVRFTEISEKSLDQIRDWISSQCPGDVLRPGPPKLPKMQLPSSRRAKRRAPRFSFADVASSRVDGEGETGAEDFPDVARDPRDLPPLQAGGVGFRDGAEAVASAFESPAFGENQIGNIQPPESEQAVQAASGQDLQSNPSPSIPERRQHLRKQIVLFTYAVLGEDNGGLVFNLGEGGLALTAAAALQEDHFAKMRVRFPDSADWFETNGRLVWKNDSGKEAGIEFLNLPEDTRGRIAEWVSQKELSSGEEENQAQELPSFMEPEQLSAEPIEIPASFEEEPFENQGSEEHRFAERAKAFAASSSALFKTGIKGILERASVKGRVAKIKPPRRAEDSDNPRTRVASKALSVAAGVALAAGGWMLLQRTSLNEASGIVAQDLPRTTSSHESPQAQENAKTEVGASRGTVNPPVQANGPTATHTGNSAGIVTPSLQQTGSDPTHNSSKTAVTIPNFSSEHTSKEKPHTKGTLEPLPVKGLSPRSSDPAQRHAAPSQHEQETKSQQLPISAPTPSSENKPAENKLMEAMPTENKTVQIAQAFPAQPKDLNATSPSPNANSSQPASAPPVVLEKEKPSVVSKQPEPPVIARTPVVSVSFDPFPSIRMPKEEKSKKSRQGKSLQMGRLLSRVDPVYPDEARQQGIEGTVKLHAIFNRDGVVQSVIQAGGPPLLVPAAMNAVRQWRYSQTILGGQAMETEEDVTVLFRLANSAAKD